MLGSGTDGVCPERLGWTDQVSRAGQHTDGFSAEPRTSKTFVLNTN